MSYIYSAKTQNRVNLFTLILAAVVAVTMQISFAYGQEPWDKWDNKSASINELVGKIWSVKKGGFISPVKMTSELAKNKYILLGEVHDNSDHHRLQAWLIDRISILKRPVIVMEMIRSDKVEILESYMGRSDANASKLGDILNWKKSGWPDWTIYQPIAEVIFKRGLKLLPGDAPRSDIRQVSKTGFNELGEQQSADLALDIQLTDNLSKTLNEEIVTSHCNMLPPTMIAPMMKVQRYRDAVLARSMIEGAHTDQPTILIAGNGHVRNDRAVPWYIARQDNSSEESIASVMLLEVAQADKFDELLELNPEGKQASDYIWFTPKVEREDPCEQLRKRFKK